MVKWNEHSCQRVSKGSMKRLSKQLVWNTAQQGVTRRLEQGQTVHLILINKRLKWVTARTEKCCWKTNILWCSIFCHWSDPAMAMIHAVSITEKRLITTIYAANQMLNKVHQSALHITVIHSYYLSLWGSKIICKWSINLIRL